MTIDFYAFDTPNGRKISVALEEMGLPYQVHVVDITKGEQTAPAFLKISPNNKIPAIIDPDGPGGQPISIFESGAILIYLAEKTGKFLPKDPRYYQFMGSLTTPPCTEDVLWMILKQPVTLSPTQMRLFAQQFPNNARTVQPINGRTVRDAQ